MAGFASWTEDITWRRSAELSDDRIQKLRDQLQVTVDIQNSVFPFIGMTLTRADVEWLLINHDNGRGPVNWDDPSQRGRRGIDLRGAVLAGEDLSGLPLARLLGGLTTEERRQTAKDDKNEVLRNAAGVHLEGANLTDTHLEGAILRAAHLEGACLYRTRFDGANISVARLEGSDCRAAHFEGASLDGTHLESFTCENPPAPMRWVLDFDGPVGEQRQIDFQPTLLAASLRLAYFDAATSFRPSSVGNRQNGFISIADARLKELNLTRVDWSAITQLGDEQVARSPFKRWGARRKRTGRITAFKTAARANSQLALVLAAQGMADQSTRFLYRALVLQRVVLRLRMLQKREFWLIVPYLLSSMLYLTTGYGYRMWRLVVTYVALVVAFAAGYALADHACSMTLPWGSSTGLSCQPHVAWLHYVLISVMAFHGRVFSQQFVLGTSQSILTACEAIVGLVVEGIFIAMLTQRVFSR